MKIQKYIKIQVARLTDRVTGEPTCARPSEGESCYFLHDGGCIHCGRGISAAFYLSQLARAAIKKALEKQE